MEYIEEYANALYNEQKSNDSISKTPMYLFTETNQQTGRQKQVTFLTEKVAVLSFLEYCDIFGMEYIIENGDYIAGGPGDVYRITLTKINENQ